MPTNNLTPEEIAALERDIAEGVMKAEAWTGDDWIPLEEFFQENTNTEVNPTIKIGGKESRMSGWSPWCDPAAALGVLKRLQALLQADGGNLPDFWIRQWWDDSGEMYGVQVGDDFKTAAPGHHYGPAVCLLALEVMKR